MFHLFHGYIRYEDDAVYIDNGLMGIEVLYHGTQKEGTYFLFPQGDQAQHTRRYYAFDTYQQKQSFKSLLKIQGVGGKSAFHIVQCAPQQIEEALETLDIGFFQRIPGVGPKLAKRLLVEMKHTWSKEEVKKLEANPKLQQGIVTSLRDLGYPVRQVKELLLEVPYEISKENLPHIMKWIIEKASI